MTALRAGLFLIAIATAAATAVLTLRVGVSAAYVALVEAASLTSAAAGIAVWQSGRGGVIGPLLWLVGVAWLIPQFRYSSESFTWTMGTWVLPTLHQASLAHLVFAYPAGALRSRPEAWVVAGCYLVATLGALAVAAFARDAATLGFGGTPRNVVLVNPDLMVWRGLLVAKTTAELSLAVLIVTLVVRRWRRSSGIARRRLGPFLIAGGLAAISFSAGYTALGFQSPLLSGLALDIHIVRWPIALLYLVVPVAIGWSVLRDRLDRSGVADLVIAAEDPNRGLDALQTALRRAVRDSSLELLTWNPERAGFDHLDGGPAGLSRGSGGQAETRVERDGRILGIVMHDPALVDDGPLLDAVIASVRLALDNQRLLAELTAQLEQVRASRGRIVEAGDIERRRIERNLHDGAQQQLVSLSLLLSLAADAASDRDDQRLVRQIETARELARDTLGDIRSLAHGIHPAVLTEEGLASAIESLARTSTIPIAVEQSIDGRLPEAVEAAAFYVVAEALTNIAKYAGATEARVRIEESSGEVTIQIDDDGVGGATLSGGSGLQGLSDRVEALGGSFRIDSPHGGGTHVQATLPCV